MDSSSRFTSYVADKISLLRKCIRDEYQLLNSYEGGNIANINNAYFMKYRLLTTSFKSPLILNRKSELTDL